MWPHPNPRKENSWEDFSICLWKISYSSSAHMHCPIIRWGRRPIKSPCSSSSTMMCPESNRVGYVWGVYRVGGGTIQSMSQSTSHDNKCCFRCGLWYIFLVIISHCRIAKIHQHDDNFNQCMWTRRVWWGWRRVAPVETQLDLDVGGRITKLFAGIYN